MVDQSEFPGVELRGSGRWPLVRAFLKLGGKSRAKAGSAAMRARQEGWLEVDAWSHALVSPSAASGLPTGKRQHEPVVITKPIDRASPHLVAALANAQIMKECVLEVWWPAAAGHDRRSPSADDLVGRPRAEALEIYLERLRRGRVAEELGYTIRLENARVARIETETLGDPCLEEGWPRPCESVYLTYERINWTWGLEEREITIARPADSAEPAAPQAQSSSLLTAVAVLVFLGLAAGAWLIADFI